MNLTEELNLSYHYIKRVILTFKSLRLRRAIVANELDWQTHQPEAVPIEPEAKLRHLNENFPHQTLCPRSQANGVVVLNSKK